MRLVKHAVSSQQKEQLCDVAKEVHGYGFEIGCGPSNRCITQYLKRNGAEAVLKDSSQLTMSLDMTHPTFSDNTSIQ